MGGSSQYAKPQQQAPQEQQNLGGMNYKPLQPLQVPSTGQEKIGEGIASATKSIADSVISGINAKYMNDQKMKQIQQMYGGYNYMRPDVNMSGD